MHQAIIAGLLSPIRKRLNSLRRDGVCSFQSGWEVDLVMPTTSKHPLPFEINVQELNKRLVQIAAENDPHVFAYKPKSQEQKNWIRENVVPYFRFRWLDNSSMQGSQKEDLVRTITYINTVLAEEEAWCGRIKPQKVSSPLILPEDLFSTRARHKDLWTRAREADSSRIMSILHEFDLFKQNHLKNEDAEKVWIDEIGNAFNWRGPRHGAAKPPRCWKFSYYLPPGFHFDVKSTKSSICTLRALDGVNHTAKYLNVDPHGSIRSASD